MTWTVYALGAALALAIADCMVKLAAGKLPNSLALLLYGCVPFTSGLIWFFYDRLRGGPMTIQPNAPLFALGVGVSFTLVTIALYFMFRAGAPISLASPLVRLGGLIVASVVGVLFWQEVISFRYVVGITLSAIGIFLIVKN
ncbi:MAG: hypothetical protein ACK4UN_09370 [Limisphaerales bacterium]